jgi:hypothetical protein
MSNCNPFLTVRTGRFAKSANIHDSNFPTELCDILLEAVKLASSGTGQRIEILYVCNDCQVEFILLGLSLDVTGIERMHRDLPQYSIDDIHKLIAYKIARDCMTKLIRGRRQNSDTDNSKAKAAMLLALLMLMKDRE